MFRVHALTGFTTISAIVMLCSTTPVFADHLDRMETRRMVRHLEERSDILQDHIANWVNERHDGREHQADEMLYAAERFDQTLAQFKLDLYSHEEPWELRGNAQNLLNAAAEFGEAVEHNAWHSELRHEWDEMRETANALARHYQLPEIGR